MILLTRTRSVSKDNLKDQSSLISSWTSTSSREPLEQYSDTRQGLVGSLRHPIKGLRFSCRSPWIWPKVESGEIYSIESISLLSIKRCVPLPWPARPWPCSSVRTYLEREAPSVAPSHPIRNQNGQLTRRQHSAASCVKYFVISRFVSARARGWTEVIEMNRGKRVMGYFHAALSILIKREKRFLSLWSYYGTRGINQCHNIENTVALSALRGAKMNIDVCSECILGAFA